MGIDDLRQDLSERLGKRVATLLTRDGASVSEMVDLYQPSPAGFGGRLVLLDGTVMTWELWHEDRKLGTFMRRCCLIVLNDPCLIVGKQIPLTC